MVVSWWIVAFLPSDSTFASVLSSCNSASIRECTVMCFPVY